MPAQNQDPAASVEHVGTSIDPQSNRLQVAIAEARARKAARGNSDPYQFTPVHINGEPLSATILRDRGPY